MSFDITGKLILKLPLLSGTSKAGNNWQKQEFVIETNESYPKKICVNLWGDRIEQLNAFNIGDPITVSFDLESREFNGRWYTDLKAWKIMPPLTSQPVTSPVVPTISQPATPPAQNFPEPEAAAEYSGADASDDLPF